jgi:glyoxylase-like metal-dependent hydrolase (beta-lactamase superfamily II)
MTRAEAPNATRESWYAVSEHGDGVTQIYEPFIEVFYRCNIWHVRGRAGCLLFDSGLGVVSLAGQLPWLRDTPLLAVASHAHFDHIGNHHEFPDRACHASEAAILAAPTNEATLASRYATLAMFSRLPPDGFAESAYAVRPAPATRVLEAGDVIDLGDRHFEVMHAPGHSPGSIALWEAASGVLLSGDAVYDGPLVDDAYHSNRADYAETMAKLAELPARVVHGGHYPSFGRTRLRELTGEYLRGLRVPGCPADALVPR